MIFDSPKFGPPHEHLIAKIQLLRFGARAILMMVRLDCSILWVTNPCHLMPLWDEEKLGWACLVDEDLMKKGIVPKMGKRQKKERLMKTSSCFLEVVCSIVSLLQGCDRSWSGGPELDVLMCDSYNGGLFSCVWWTVVMVEAQREDGSRRLQKGNYGEDKKQRYPQS